MPKNPSNDAMATSASSRMPALIYGTAWKGERTRELVVQAVQAGFRGIDTACQPKHYHEPGVGEALRELSRLGIGRDELYVQTKFTPVGGQDPARIPYDPRAPLADQVSQSFASSKRNLEGQSIDALILHSPLPLYADLMQVWRAMEALALQGEVGQLGISNCYEAATLQRLFKDAEVKPRILQNRFYADSAYDRSLRAWCDEAGIVYQSFWTLTANPHILRSQVLEGLARQYEKSPEQVFFRALSQRGIVPLTGTCSQDHMLADLGIFEFTLSPDELQAIDELLK